MNTQQDDPKDKAAEPTPTTDDVGTAAPAEQGTTEGSAPEGEEHTEKTEAAPAEEGAATEGGEKTADAAEGEGA